MPSVPTPSDAMLPFDGLRVLDLSQGIAGPYCGQILWEQGADVVKVEPPDGDWGRNVGAVRAGHSALSIAYNAGKRGLCLDARTAGGKATLGRLAREADVVIQNFRPGVAARLGIDQAELAADRPELVYVSISGYGQDGPFADAPATDSVMQADSGLMFANQSVDGEPRRIGLLMADIVTALYAVQATTAALYRQARGGGGAHVELSLFEACAAVQRNDLLAYAMTGTRVAGPVSAPNGVFETADGRLTLLALNNDQFGRLCRALGRAEWVDDPDYADNAARMARQDALHRQIAAQLREQPTDHWIARLAREEVLHARVRDYADLLVHPQALHLGLMASLSQPGGAPLPCPRVPGLSAKRPPTPAPAIGQHSIQVLADWGLDAAETDALLQAGVVRQQTEGAA